jgi:hypothetical protein
MWMMGFCLTVATIADHRLGMVVTGASTMALFIPWAAGLATRL